jgi:hypothetical protein
MTRSGGCSCPSNSRSMLRCSKPTFEARESASCSAPALENFTVAWTTSAESWTVTLAYMTASPLTGLSHVGFSSGLRLGSVLHLATAHVITSCKPTSSGLAYSLELSAACLRRLSHAMSPTRSKSQCEQSSPPHWHIITPPRCCEHSCSPLSATNVLDYAYAYA